MCEIFFTYLEALQTHFKNKRGERRGQVVTKMAGRIKALLLRRDSAWCGRLRPPQLKSRNRRAKLCTVAR